IMTARKKENLPVPTKIIDTTTVEDEEERRVIEGAKAILRAADFGYSGNLHWFKEKAAYQAAGYIAINREALVDLPEFDPLMAHFQAGDYEAVERHLLAKWGIKSNLKKGWIPNALER
ncbi:MAG: hypothetical protein ACREOB_07765, partial [Thermodesulfobacteriota bacterium]